MKKSLFIALACVCALASACAMQPESSMHPKEQLKFVKHKIKRGKEPYKTAYIQLIHYADSLQTLESHALEDFSVPGYYVIPEKHVANSKSLQQDAFAAYCSALAYCLSGEEKYADKACFFLNQWAEINKLYSDPDGPLVMSYSGNAMVMAAELMRSSGYWPKAESEKFAEWVVNVYRKACNEIRERTNNWADWGRFGSLLADSYLGDMEDAARNIELMKSDFASKICPDGHMPEEVRRGANGIWYTYFSLGPMTSAFWVAYNLTGENLFALDIDGSTVEGALDYLLKYVYAPSDWPWFENPNQGSHKLWPDDLFEAMYGIYGKDAYLKRVEATRPHIYPVHHFGWTFPTLLPPSLDGWK